MPLIDHSVTWQKPEARLAEETDPVLRRNLELLIEHMKAEASLDMDRLMATVSEKARYESFTGQPGNMGLLVGKAAVRKFYEDFAASGAYKLQLEIDRLIVDRRCILTEGMMRMAYPGRIVEARGKKVADPNAYYLYECRIAIVWTIGDDGLFIGEDSYSDRDGFEGIENRPIDSSEIVVWTKAA